MPCKDKIRQRAHQHKHYQSHKEYYRDRRERRRNKIMGLYMTFKSKQKCLLCPEDDQIAIDFHHLESDEKESLIHQMAHNGRSWLNIIIEIKKCVPLCANCHRKVHKYQVWADKLTAALPTFHWIDLDMVRVGIEPTFSCL